MNYSDFHIQKIEKLKKGYQISMILSAATFFLWIAIAIYQFGLGEGSLSDSALIVLVALSIISGFVTGIFDIYQWKDNRGILMILLNWLTASAFSLVISMNEYQFYKDYQPSSKTPTTPKTYYDYDQHSKNILLAGFTNAKMILFSAVCLLFFGLVWQPIYYFSFFLIFIGSIMAASQYIKTNQIFSGVIIILSSFITLGMWPLWMSQKGLQEIKFVINNPKRKKEYEQSRKK